MGKLKTQLQFEGEINVLTQGSYRVLSPYRGSREWVIVEHLPCQHQYQVMPVSFLQGYQTCPQCYGRREQRRKRCKTHETFVRQVQRATQGEFQVEGRYESAMSPLQFQHLTCQTRFEMTPNTFLARPRCPTCRTRLRKEAKFKEDLVTLTGHAYRVVGTYLGQTKPIELQHVKCGTRFETQPTQFLKGYHRCPTCQRTHPDNRTTQSFSKEVTLLTRKQFKTRTPYQGMNDPVLFHHVRCGESFLQTPAQFLMKPKCSRCGDIVKIKGVDAHQRFVLKVQQLVQHEYEVVGTYENEKTLIRLKHAKCQQSFEIQPRAFLNHRKRCPFC